jgi:hypothetical protein
VEFSASSPLPADLAQVIDALQESNMRKRKRYSEK